MLLVAAPASATHLTHVTLDSAVVPVGTPSVVLSGNVHAETDCGAISSYGWILSSPNGTVSPSSQAPSGPVDTAYTLTVDTSGLPAGVYGVQVSADWQTPPVCVDGPDGVATATITITGRFGGFICNAVTGRLGPGHYGEANPAGAPCQDDTKWSTTLPIGTVASVTAAQAVTSQTPDNLNAVPPAAGDNGTAYASAATIVVRIGAVRIAVAAVSATATARCSVLHTPGVSSSSKVVGLRINGGFARTLTGYAKISVAGLVTIELNKTTVVGHTRTQQALVISSSLTQGKLVIGEATAGYTGNPCGGVFV
jgi:hypothetical protein